MAALIDAKEQRLVREGHDEVSILGEMFDCMPIFKMLLDSGQDSMDELCQRFAGFEHVGKFVCGSQLEVKDGSDQEGRTERKQRGKAAEDRFGDH
jgi:hypothetical protein